MDKKQQADFSKPHNGRDEHETAYWHSVNKDHDARKALLYLQDLDAHGIVNAIAAAKSNEDVDIFKRNESLAIDFEFAVICFLQELKNATSAKESTK